MVFSWDGADAEVQAQDWDEAAESPELDFEDELETPRPRRTSQSSKRSKDSGGSTARRRFSAEGRGVSLYSVGSGFSSASVFDRLELPSEKRPWRELLIPLGIMMFFLALVLSTALLTNSVKITVFTEGSFSYTTQVSDEATAQWVRWQRAQRLAEPTVGQGLPGGAAMVAQVTWRRLVLIYQLPQADTVSSVGLQRAKAVEDTLRALPLWQSLCGEMPISYQALCLEGDSMVSASHGSLTQVSAADVAAGVQADIRLDGNGTEELIDLETLTRIFEERSPDTLERWLPKDRYGAQGKEAFRSSFTFALNPTRADTLWRALVLDEVEPSLVRLGFLSAAREKQDDFRVYLEADDLPELDPQDLKRSMDEDLPLLVFGPLGAFLATLAMRGRVFVAMVAGVLALSVPLVTSVGFLAQSTEENLTEVRIIAAAAWFVISAGMADLCSACTHALEERKESLRPQVPEWLMVRMLITPRAWLLEEASGHRALALRMLRVVCEALLPTLALGLTLLLLTPQLEMVSDFAMHAGLGLLIGVPLAAMLVPPAIEAGDVMASQILAWRSETDMETSEAFQLLFDNIFPMEFGAKQDWQSEAKFKMRKRMRDFLRLRWLSLTVLLLLLGLLIIYCVASLQGSSVYTAETPRLFQVGHRLYDKARVSGLFDPLEDYQAPMRDALQEARRCSPTASTSAQCTWFKCDAGPSAELQDDLEPSECQCYTVKGSGACTSAAARLFGAKAGGIAQGLFWSWAGARLGTVYSNASTWAEGLLEIEVWSSGGRSLNPAVQSTVEAASWETACLQILCFCGGMECRSESWSSLGTLEYGTTFDSAWSLNEANDSVNAETSVVTNDPDLVNLSFAWGIQVSSEPLSGETGLSFSRTLVLEDLDSQRQLLAFCEGTAPDLEIVQRSCWPIDFKRWLQERGSYYPVVPNTFYGSLRQFFDEKAANDRSLGRTDSQALNGFWLTGEGTAKALYFTFQVAADPGSGTAAQLSRWQEYLSLRNRGMPATLGPAWFAPQSEVVAAGQVATAAVVQQNAMSVAIFFILFPALILLLTTWSWGLACTSSLLIALSMMILEFHHTRVNHKEIGVLEIVALLAYNSFVTLGLFRVSVHISWSQDGPGRDPGRRHRKHVQAQKVGRLSVLEGLCEEAEEADGKRFCLRSISKSRSFLESFLERKEVRRTVEDLSFPERKMLLRHMAVLNSPAIFEGGLRHERLGRSARAACRAGTEAITSVICLAISCLSVLLTTMEGISQVCIVCLCGGVASVLLTVGIHPVLMLVGFGPAKVKGRAWALYVWWLSAGCPRPSKEPPEGLLDTDLGSLGESAGQVLGPPFSWVRSTQKQPSPEEPEKEVTVNHLEMQGATAMPPFHGATVHKGLFRGDG